jgi:hypothetical protein
MSYFQRGPNVNAKHRTLSPLYQVQWKRLVIDEGHVSSSTSSTLVPSVRLLSMERRQIVTCMLTTNLLGLSFGNKTGKEKEDGEAIGEEDEDDDYFSSYISHGGLTGSSSSLKPLITSLECTFFSHIVQLQCSV